MNVRSFKRQTQGAAHSGKARLPVATPERAVQQSLFAIPAVVPAAGGDEAAGRLAMRSTDTIKPHPSLLKQNLRPTEERLLALEKLGDAIFEQPLLVTRENLIVDGYARWLIAQRQHRATLLCIECQLSAEEALQRILQTQRLPEWLNAFSRIQLALELEPWFREQARTNQSNGGKAKASSNLTEDQRIDCRQQIAALAGVSTGNITKVKQILKGPVSPQLIEALRLGEISSHCAWTLSKESISNQESALGTRRFKKRTQMRIRKLLSKSRVCPSLPGDSLHHLMLGLTGLRAEPRMAHHWKQIDDLITALERDFATERSQADAGQTDTQADPRRQPESLGLCADSASGPRKLPESARLPNPCAGG